MVIALEDSFNHPFDGDRLKLNCDSKSDGEESDEDHSIDPQDEDEEHECIPELEVFKTTDDWKELISSSECAEDLQEIMITVRPYTRCEKTNKIVATENMKNMIEGFVQFLTAGEKVSASFMKGLTTEIFGACDLFYLCAKYLTANMKKLGGDDTKLWNIFNYLKNIPNPKECVLARFYKSKESVLKPGKRGKNRILNIYQVVWMSFLKNEFPNKLLSALIPFITENVLDGLKEPHLIADFFFKIFARGEVYGILSLEAIFKLIVKHNFEHDKFFDEVYSMVVPSVCYMAHKEKFFTLVDTFLMSSHLPAYIVAGFVKRLSRLALYAPFDAQESLIALVRNLLIRHPAIKTLTHRPIQGKLNCDPYDERKPLRDCGAMESSLWELKTIQKHWLADVAKLSQFVEKPNNKLESFVRHRNTDAYFKRIFNRKFGTDLASKEAQFEQEQDGSDSERKPIDPQLIGEKPKGKKSKRKLRNDAVGIDTTIPTNFRTPDGSFFPKNAFLLNYDKFWNV